MEEHLKTFKEFIIRTTPFLPEIVSGILWELPMEGIVEEENYIKVYSSEKSKIRIEHFEHLIKNLVNQDLIKSFSIEENEIENRNWNEDWEKSINIIKVSNRIIIKPSFREYIPQKNQIVITIDPKMSFGTGEHQSTQLVLRLLEKNITNGCNVLDVGTGSGILAIASIKLGAVNAIGIDNDEWSYNNALENIRLNEVSDKIEIRLAEINKINEQNFDLILANIQKNILMDISGEIKNHLKHGGMIILSGVLTTDKEEIYNCYKNLGFTKLQTEKMDDWIALLMKG
jgi:ribosomal protein L11 methyltransferase